MPVGPRPSDGTVGKDRTCGSSLPDTARRVAHGDRNFENYRLCMLLAASGTRGRRFTASTT